MTAYNKVSSITNKWYTKAILSGYVETAKFVLNYDNGASRSDTKRSSIWE